MLSAKLMDKKEPMGGFCPAARLRAIFSSDLVHQENPWPILDTLQNMKRLSWSK
jgi:hypothetical protein